jgi:hypothetical protein
VAPVPHPAPPRIDPAALAAWARREGVELAVVPSLASVERINAVLARLHAIRAAPRAPAPAAVLEWLDVAGQHAAALAALAPADAALRLVPDLSLEDLAALDRLRAAFATARWQYLARAVAATGGRPRTGRAEARAELGAVAADLFDPPLGSRARRRFTAWALSAARAGKGGSFAPCFGHIEGASLG